MTQGYRTTQGRISNQGYAVRRDVEKDEHGIIRGRLLVVDLVQLGQDSGIGV